MKKIFSKKTVAITAVTIFMVSLFAWGLVVGNLSDSTTTEIEVQSVMSLEVSPDAIRFDSLGVGGAGDYGIIEGGDTDIYADSTVTATATSGFSYDLNIYSSEMAHATETHTIPATNTSISRDSGASWYAGELNVAGEDAVTNGEGYLIDLRVDEVPIDVYTGTYAGEITFDLTTVN